MSVKMYTNTPSSSHGFTLIEVAIAMLVLAVGLLGIAGIQSKGMQSTHLSHQRSVAMTQALDLADRIRANIAGLRAMDYSITIPTSAPSPDCQTSSNSCTAAELAATDLYNWQTDNASLLPSGQGSISCTDIDAGTTATLEAGSSCLITVLWDGNRDGSTGTLCNGAAGQLTCLRMRITP
jgi:type IV pilus assembly protein PilV